MLLSVNNVTVKYGEVIAVNNLTFGVGNEVYCLLGPNGAGKSSTLKAIMNMINFSGTIEINGMSNRRKEVKNLVGYVPEQPALYEHMTPSELIGFVLSVRGLKNADRANKLVNAFSLEQYMNTPIAQLSMGNRQKVSILIALLHSPKLLILDEAFNSLDIVTTRILKEIMNSQIKEGGGIVFSTHIMEIAEKVCNRIGIMRAGSIVLETEPGKVREAGKTLEDVFLSVTGLDEQVREIVKGLES
ncbi:hypothetical protein HS7_04070 [Sulfolobales archaeon HS-7]|nr:hypothetical protein HS7_04070 [Sulfolobales archaeon HS-7]